MGRVAVTVGTPDSSASVLDRCTDKVLLQGSQTSGTSSLWPAGAGSLLSKPADQMQARYTAEKSASEQDVTVRQVWYQLAGPERQRFGQCFSVMVLKALGLRSCEKEVLP
jgi:hypothetical protein